MNKRRLNFFETFKCKLENDTKLLFYESLKTDFCVEYSRQHFVKILFVGTSHLKRGSFHDINELATEQ